MYSAIIIGISEIWTKSEKVKKLLLKKLIYDIKRRLSEIKVELRRGRIIVRPYHEEHLKELKKIFGIKFCAPVCEVKSEYDAIKSKISEFLRDRSGKFRIEVKRVWKGFPATSIELQKKLGTELLQEYKDLVADMKNPDFKIYVEIHEDVTFIYDRRVEGYDGYPIGTQGKGLSLFSGGIDSPVAAWLTAKRGISVHLLFLNLAGSIHETMVYSVYEKLKEWLPDAKLYVVDATELIDEIVTKVRKGYRQIVYKVFLYKIAEQVARKLKTKIVITGESLGQVSTQTLDSLVLLEDFISIPVFRPLIGFNKEEIVSMAKEIGTLGESEKVMEVCMLEKHSNASPRKEIVLEEVDKIKIDIDTLVKNLRLAKKEYDQTIFSFIPKNVRKEELEIIDLEKTTDFKPKTRKSLLFLCPMGVTAHIFAKKYREKGFNAYSLDYKTAKRLGYL